MKTIKKSSIDKRIEAILKRTPNFMPPKSSPIYLGMSGGVDSSFAAYLLKHLGYEVHGIFLKCWDENDPECKAKQDQKDALKIAAQLDIQFEVVDYTKEYSDKVASYVFNEYSKGNTPNPDILCNTLIKFGLLYDKVLHNRGDAYLSTGHYAALYNINGRQLVSSPIDKSKDQSYFLYDAMVRRQSLRVCFPLGNFLKSEVRQMSEEVGLKLYNKPDSTGLCFVGDVNIRNLLSKNIKPILGDVINLNGDLIDKNINLLGYTIGQSYKHPNLRQSDPEELYVIDKDSARHILVADSKKHSYSDLFMISSFICIDDSLLNNKKALSVRLRNLGEKHELIDIRNVATNNDKTPDLLVKLKERAFGIAPGQHAVIYKGDMVVGGGVISKVNTDYKKRVLDNFVSNIVK